MTVLNTLSNDSIRSGYAHDFVLFFRVLEGGGRGGVHFVKCRWFRFWLDMPWGIGDDGVIFTNPRTHPPTHPPNLLSLRFVSFRCVFSFRFVVFFSVMFFFCSCLASLIVCVLCVLCVFFFHFSELHTFHDGRRVLLW